MTPSSLLDHIHGMAARLSRQLLATTALWMAFPNVASATHLDGEVFDFEQGDGTDFSSSFCRHALPCDPSGPPLTTFATSTLSGKYLGTFGEETLSFFALDALDIIALQTDRAYLSFDLILTGGWAGGGQFDPDDPNFTSFFAVAANGRTLFDAYLANLFPGFRHFDLVFDFTSSDPDCCTDVEIAFSARLSEGYDQFPELDPTWGIDNFVVSSTPIPEPMTGALVGLGLLGLAARRRIPSAHP